MAKPLYVWTGSAWVAVASEVESLATYATQSYADNTPGMKLVVPTSVAVGSGSGSVAAQGTVTFSGASSISLNGVFSSTYDNYRILVTSSASADNNFYIRMRTAGVDNTTASSYINQRLLANSTTVSGVRNTTDTFDGINIFNTDNFALDMTMYRPFLAKTTLLTAHTNYATSSASVQLFSGQHNQSTSYDGVTFYIGTGTLTGTVNVYGYKKG